jgi:hypothetical protein
MLYRLYHKMDQVIPRQPIPHVYRKQHRRLAVYVYKSFAHVFSILPFLFLRNSLGSPTDSWKECIADSELREPVDQLEAGQADTNLDGGVYKIRIARPGEGKSGG